MKNRKLLTFIIASAVVAAAVLGVAVLRQGTPGDGHGAEHQAGADAQDGQAIPTRQGLAVYDLDGDGIVYQSGMHPWIVQDEPGQCPICGMDLMPVRVDEVEDGAVRIDPVTLQNIGVRTAAVTIEPLSRRVRTTGRFEMDERGSHTVTLKVGGWVENLHADFNGAIVHRGEPLLDLYSPELVSTQQEYLLALRNMERLEGTPAGNDARRLLEAAKRRLSFWDLTEEQIAELERTGEPRRTMRFHMPASGEVMNKRVIEGQYVNAGEALMDVVDVSRIWLIVDVYEKDLDWVVPGTQAFIALPYSPGRTFQGRVDHVFHMLDKEMRTARARITLPGAHGGPMRPGMYATVTLEGGITEPLPVVPEEAVIRTGEREVVILALGEGRFMPSDVVTGLESGGRVQILQGLAGDERVVTSAQFLIDSEARLRSALNAMTAGHEH